MDPSVSGKTVIVTGAANGVGLAIARRFVELEANVVLADRDEKRLNAEVEAASRSTGLPERILPDVLTWLKVTPAYPVVMNISAPQAAHGI